MNSGRATVVGVGVIGGSIASALKARGWEVFGWDTDKDRLSEAVECGIVDVAEFQTDVSITFVATPVSEIPAAVERALAGGGIVTDTGSVKGGIVDAISHERFVAGHPMAGSEKSGLAGVDAHLFEGATWVLTPGPKTDPDVYSRVKDVVASMGAGVVTLDASQHDEMVATISHVPHLTATALMRLALQRVGDHDAVLRLAAGGFRDMTRIAAGHPELWADITMQNRGAISVELRRLSETLTDVAMLLEKGDRQAMRELLDESARARRELPLRSGRPAKLSLVRVPIPDRAGALGEVLGIFGELRINVEDLEIAHDVKGDRGTLQLTIATSGVLAAIETLSERGFRSSVENL